MNEIIKAVYGTEVNEHDYMKLYCTMEDGSEEIFHYHKSNPMPKEYAIEGHTIEYLRGMCEGMSRMALNETHVKLDWINKED